MEYIYRDRGDVLSFIFYKLQGGEGGGRSTITHEFSIV